MAVSVDRQLSNRPESRGCFGRQGMVDPWTKALRITFQNFSVQKFDELRCEIRNVLSRTVISFNFVLGAYTCHISFDVIQIRRR